MTDPRHKSPGYKRKVAGGLIIAAAAGLTAAAQDLPPLESEAPATEAAPAPAPAPRAPAPLANPSAGTMPYAGEICPPRRPGPIRRWHERCKANCRDKLWGYPEEFQDAPLGAMLEGHLAAQIANGRAARMVLYQYDFIPGTDRLKQRGRIQLAKFIPCLHMYGIIVEPSGSGPALDEARRQTVLRELAGDEFRIAGAQVVVGRPLRRGIEGPEGALVERSLMNQTTIKGGTSVTGGGGGGGSSSSTSSSSGGGSQSTSTSSPSGGR